MPAPAASPLDPYELVGQWRLHRRVVDRRRSAYGLVVGTLVVHREGDVLVWHESGSWTMAGRTHPVSRTYLLAEGWMRFEDGRPFHPWTPGERVAHRCGYDVYRGLVDVAPGRIRTLWDVTGPAKDQRLVTRLTPIWQSGRL